MNFQSDWLRLQKCAEQALEDRLPHASEEPKRLHEAMRYAVLQGGKRFRAVLVMMTGELFDTDLKISSAAAAAVECLHAYSLVHDDLPSMDDDDFRRGRPSCHKAYDEATAVLVGDALLTLSFEILSSDKVFEEARINQNLLVAALAEAAGSRGMVGGQSLDVHHMDDQLSQDEITVIHRLKTARLIQASVKLGCLVSDQYSNKEYLNLSQYGECLGLSFQFADDGLDGENSEINTHMHAQIQRDLAIEALRKLNRKTDNLEELAHFVVDRTS